MEPKTKDIIGRIEEVRTTLELKKSRFSTAIGMKPQTYNNFIGQQGSKPNVELITGVCKVYHVAPQWLLFGVGDPGDWAMGQDVPNKETLESLMGDNTTRRMVHEVLGRGNLRASEELRKAEEEAGILLRKLRGRSGNGRSG